MILNHLPISAYSGVLKFDMKIFVHIAKLEIGQLFTKGPRRGHPCTLDTFLVLSDVYVLFIYECGQLSKPRVSEFGINLSKALH